MVENGGNGAILDRLFALRGVSEAADEEQRSQ
jgi:hypothetical protein